MDDLRAELERVDANTHQAPVDIKLADTVPLAVPDLAYQNYDNTPVKMKLNNTGYTVTVSGKFDGDPPVVSGGPLDGSYKFSQLHFHWGPDDREGSEHTFEGRGTPLEMHVVHVNEKYASQEEALLQKDGVVIVTFMFISGGKHAGLDGLTRGLAEVTKPHTSFKISPQPLQSLCTLFKSDYFSYWGAVISPSCSHLIQWLICRDPLEASADQVAAFRQLLNVNEQPLLRNYRDRQEMRGRTVFHLAPGSREGFTLNCSPERMAAPTERGDAAGAAHPEASALSADQACTSLGEAESKAALNLEAERAEAGAAEAGIPVKTESGRELERTASGRMLERTASGRLVQRTPSGRELERTASGQMMERTASGRLVGKTASGRTMERTASGRLMAKTASGNLEEVARPEAPQITLSPSGNELTRTPSGRLVQATPSGRQLERTLSGGFKEEKLSTQAVDLAEDEAGGGAGAEAGAEAGAAPGEAGTAATGGLERTGSGSGRLPGMGSRAVSFSQLTGPIKERAEGEWPDAPYEGASTASPVFIDANGAARMPLPPLEFLGHFQKGVGLVLSNSGETVEISLLKASERPVLQGGPLRGRYILDSAHFHWLPNDDATGGTHTINNARSEVECHLVHIHEDYKSKTEAMDHPNGLAVVSILHQVGGAECDAFQRLCKELPRIDELYTQVELPGLDLSYMESVVKPHEYFLYPGRFFGRDDGKALVWIVFAQPIGICCQNVAAFQSLKLSKDFRQHDTYPLGGRPLYAVVAGGVGGAGGEGAVGAGDGEPAEDDEELLVGELRRTASGRVLALRPDEWPNTAFQSKHGILMAPLDIKTSDVPSIAMPPLEYRGHFSSGAVPVEMRNTGDNVTLTWTGQPVPELSGGPLPEEYVFDSAHFHWAQNPDDVGAMHRVNGKRCDLEFHMVHFKKSLKTRQEAMFVPDGLAITSFLIKVGGQENESFAKLTDALPSLKEVESSVELQFDMDWLQHRAGPHGFFTYPGTLFGADQDINAIWIVYPTPVQICCQHIALFYKLDCLDCNRVHPLHELLDRPIFHSINPDNCT